MHIFVIFQPLRYYQHQYICKLHSVCCWVQKETSDLLIVKAAINLRKLLWNLLFTAKKKSFMLMLNLTMTLFNSLYSGLIEKKLFSTCSYIRMQSSS